MLRGYRMSQSKYAALTYIKFVLLNQQNVTMGLGNSIYEWLHGVECHYHEGCRYQIDRENEGKRHWIRKCVCRRKLSKQEVSYDRNKVLGKEKVDDKERWYKLKWYDQGDRELLSRQVDV